MADRSRTRIAVIGLGRFGSSLLLALEQREIPVIGIDRDAAVVQSLSEQVRNIVVADGTMTEALRQLDIGPSTRAVIAVAGIQSSLLTMTALSELGVPEVWAKASSQTHAKILHRLGAQHVVQPEHDMGTRLSHRLAGHMMDYLEFDDDVAFAKTTVPDFAVGRPLGESAIRTDFRITVVAVKRLGEAIEYATAETVPRPGDTLIISGLTSEVERFSQTT